MSEAVTHQMMLLRPLQAGLTGYARLQGEPGRQLVQVNLRGMQTAEMRVFWYAGEGMMRELGRSPANRRGEASLCADLPTDAAAPRRLTALLIADGQAKPKPLAIGLCTAQSAGSLLDAKNALLALCEKLSREAEEQKAAARLAKGAAMESSTQKESRKKAEAEKKRETARQAGGLSKVPETKGLPMGEPSPVPAPKLPSLPREVFLPAIEARRQTERRRMQRRKDGVWSEGDRTAGEATPELPPAACAPVHTSEAGNTNKPPQIPADSLPALQWPESFLSLADYFKTYPPRRLMDWPGWRFVYVPGEPHGLWIGYCRKDDRVSQVAYALPADAAPPQGQPFRPASAADGRRVQLLVLQA